MCTAIKNAINGIKLCFSFSRGLKFQVVYFFNVPAPDPLPGLCPWTPLGDFRPPDSLICPQLHLPDPPLSLRVGFTAYQAVIACWVAVDSWETPAASVTAVLARSPTEVAQHTVASDNVEASSEYLNCVRTLVAETKSREETFSSFFSLLIDHKTLHSNVLPCTKRAGQRGTDNRH